MRRRSARRRGRALLGLGAAALFTCALPQLTAARGHHLADAGTAGSAAGSASSAASSRSPKLPDAGTASAAAESATSTASSRAQKVPDAGAASSAPVASAAASSRAQKVPDAGAASSASGSATSAPAPARASKPGDASAVSAPVASAPAAAAIDAGSKPDAATSPPPPLPPLGEGSPSAPQAVPPPPVPQLTEESFPQASAAHGAGGGKGKHAKAVRTKAAKPVLTDLLLESQNHSLAIARRYAQLLAGGRYEEARLMHEEEGGRRPDWSNLRTAAQAYSELHGAPRDLEQHLVTWTGAELLTFFFTAHYKDGTELPIRVAVDHNGNVAGAAIGSEAVAATKKRYDRYDHYHPRTELTLPFYGTWTVSNASPNSGNGHYLNANQRFAVDFYITEEVEPGKRKSHRGSGRQNTDYFAFGQDVLAPADGTVIMVVDGVPDNQAGQVDIYYRLGNSVVISLGNNEYAHLCHLQNGSMQVRIGDKVTRGQVVAKCGNSGNSTAPHLHFQLTDGPRISHSASLPAYFTITPKDGARASVLLMSGDRPTHAPPKGATATPAPAP